jgi:transcriptional regulator NrdR family protein
MTTKTHPKLACPSCGDFCSLVVNVRATAAGVYRRRECESCHFRFSTREVITTIPRRRKFTNHNSCDTHAQPKRAS